MHNSHIVAAPYYDPKIAEAIERRARESARRNYNRMIKVYGGNWRCRGGCGRTISATKELCLACHEKGVIPNALGLAGPTFTTRGGVADTPAEVTASSDIAGLGLPSMREPRGNPDDGAGSVDQPHRGAGDDVQPGDGGSDV